MRVPRERSTFVETAYDPASWLGEREVHAHTGPRLLHDSGCGHPNSLQILSNQDSELADPSLSSSTPMTTVTGVSGGTERPMFGSVQRTCPGIPNAARGSANLSPTRSSSARASDADDPRTSGTAMLPTATDVLTEAALGGAGGPMRARIKTAIVTITMAQRPAPTMTDDRRLMPCRDRSAR